VNHSQDPDEADGDALLVLRVAEGDAAAYHELVARHAAPLRHFALRVTRDAADADDVVQETFLRLWQRAADYVPEARVTTWLHRIAHNSCVDRLRAKRRLEALDDESDAPPVSASQPRLLEAKRRAQALEEALALIPERQAAALTLVHLNGLSGAEAAEVLSVSEEALESLLSRGRRALKARLGVAAQPDVGESS